eukprot:TRINITY_DN121120_c0_g1_i1.p1 TRINITY_DN121120_c0_g1~~TRINITY_DN121120_c0_g1_i1.p1  ORF type:complete len:590 (-),score=148.16 TRINITY_DN121120_c0_g1_i1:74-1843(-)
MAAAFVGATRPPRLLQRLSQRGCSARQGTPSSLTHPAGRRWRWQDVAELQAKTLQPWELRPSRSSSSSSSCRRFCTSSTSAEASKQPVQPLAESVGAAGSAGTEVDPSASSGEPSEDGEIPPEVEQLFGTLRDEALRRLDEFGPIHLFSLCWAYSTARLLDEDLEAKIQRAALRLGRQRDNEPFPSKDKRRRKGPQGQSAEPERAESALPLEVEVDRAAAVTEAPDGPKAADDSQQGFKNDMAEILVEKEHWMALYKPPFWTVSVDSKEAAKAKEAAASVGPFEEQDEEAAEGEDAEAEEMRKRPRLQHWVQQNRSGRHPIHNDSVEAFGLMHRLDIQTSGILICAKSYVGAYWLRLQWCSYAVDKEYVALVHGWVDRDVREIHKRIRVDKKKAPNSRRTVSTHCSISDSGKPSFTEVCTLAHLTLPAIEAGTESAEGASLEPTKYTLVALKLHTGRTHQIRVHMKSLGHPLVCDVKYGEEQFPADRAWCRRNFLHTYRLAFEDVPEGGELSVKKTADNDGVERPLQEVFCELAPDLRAALSRLEPVDEVSSAALQAWKAGDRSLLKSFEEFDAERDALVGDSAASTKE